MVLWRIKSKIFTIVFKSAGKNNLKIKEKREFLRKIGFSTKSNLVLDVNLKWMTVVTWNFHWSFIWAFSIQDKFSKYFHLFWAVCGHKQFSIFFSFCFYKCQLKFICWIQMLENVIQSSYHIVTMTFKKYQKSLVTVFFYKHLKFKFWQKTEKKHEN